MRFYNPGPSNVLKAILDGRESVPTDTLKEIQPGFDVRALRPWEYFHERILRWAALLSSAAVAGETSSCGFGNIGVPFGLLCIDTIISHSAQTIQLRTGDDPSGATGGNLADALDTRWGIGALQGPSTLVNGHSIAAAGSPIVQVPPSTAIDVGLCIQADGNGVQPFQPNQVTLIRGVTVNTAVSVSVIGRLLLYRLRA